MLENISRFLEKSQGVDAFTGLSVDESLAAAYQVYRRLQKGVEERGLELLTDRPDVVHALARILMSECARNPIVVVNQTRQLRDWLAGSESFSAQLQEREELLLFLAFVAWRAARILERSKESQHWEAEYRRAFRASLSWKVTESVCSSEILSSPSSSFPPTRWADLDPEGIFQSLLYLYEQSERSPEMIRKLGESLHQQLAEGDLQLPNDLSSFFLGASARLIASSIRITGSPDDSLRWLAIAESYFRTSPKDSPELARVTFARLAILYNLSRVSAVIEASPALCSTFDAFGMNDDTAKCRLLWSESLKLCGRYAEALHVLEPLRQSRAEINPALYGWMLAESGDLHGILGNYRTASPELEEATNLLRDGGHLTGLAFVSGVRAWIFRAEGHLTEAIDLFRVSQGIYSGLGMKGFQAYHQLLIAETFLAMDRTTEAEAEVVTALPLLEERGFVAETAAGISLLREAVRRRKLSPQLIRDIRGKLRF